MLSLHVSKWSTLALQFIFYLYWSQYLSKEILTCTKMEVANGKASMLPNTSAIARDLGRKYIVLQICIIHQVTIEVFARREN